MGDALRKNRYAELCADARLTLDEGHEHRLERIWVKDGGYEAIRWSCWKQGRMIPRPAHLKEEELVALLEKALDQGVFSSFFTRQLLTKLERQFIAAMERGEVDLEAAEA